MSATEVFIKALQEATDSDLFPEKFWRNYSEKDTHTFQDALDKYAEYYRSLQSSEQKEALSKIFWQQIEAIGTPIIENRRGEDNCNVYFLFPKSKISDSSEKQGTKKDLYLQGDFHGYGSTDGKQRLLELSSTEIMWHKDSMPREAIVVYSYLQVEPRHHGKKPVPERSPFFNDGEGFTPHSTETNFPEIPESDKSACRDEYSTHTFPYPGFDWGERIFRVSADSKHAHIQSKPIDWPSLLSAETPSHSRNFVYHATLYSDQTGVLHRSDASVTKQYHDDLYYSNGYNLSSMAVPSFNELDTKKLGEKPYLIKDEEKGEYKIWGYKEGTWQLTDIDSSKVPPTWKPNQTVFVSITDESFNTLKKGHTPYLPYTNFTRAIQVFKPASGKIDDIIVINDGMPYLITGILDQIEKMAKEKNLSPNTAFVFINTMPGLKTTLSQETTEAFDKDPSANLSGMGVRLIDYKHGIDQYIDFIANKLFPQLKKEKISVPDDPKHRVMIGSSLSGTASIYIGLKRPDVFGAVIAQSPSPDNRAILSKIPKEMLTKRNIHLSCGKFEHPDYAAANANIEYATELSDKLDIRLHEGAHGHQFIPWIKQLEQSLPATLKASLASSVQRLKKSTESLFSSFKSFFSQPKESPNKTDKQDEKKIQVLRKRGG